MRVFHDFDFPLKGKAFKDLLHTDIYDDRSASHRVLEGWWEMD